MFFCFFCSEQCDESLTVHNDVNVLGFFLIGAEFLTQTHTYTLAGFGSLLKKPVHFQLLSVLVNAGVEKWRKQ